MYCFAQINGVFKTTAEAPYKWDKKEITYSIKNTTKDIEKKLRLALNLAMTTWDIHIPINLKFVKEGGDMTLEFSHTDPYFTSESILAYAYFPQNSIYDGKIVFNDNVLWSLDGKPVTGEEYQRLTGKKVQYLDNMFKTYNLTHTLIHEIGHSLGLVHSGYSDDVMYPYYNGLMELSEHDKDRIQYKYGKLSRPKRFLDWLILRKKRLANM